MPRHSTILICLAVLAVAVLGLREIRSEDLGYHLAYGTRFLQGEGVVDHDARIYTNPAPDPAHASPAPDKARPDPGPGCWYDASGRYRFANANWGSQVIMAAAWRAGGDAGLTALLIAMLALVGSLLVRLLRQLGAPTSIAVVSTVAWAMLAAPRLTVRPELFGYVMLLLQANLLASRRRPRDVDLGALALAQILFVNMHGYFVLGVALVGAALVGRVLERGLSASSVRRLAIALAASIAACFLNPWGWRLAALPLETVWFLHVNDIAAGAGAHPWSVMGELHRALPLPSNWISDPISVLFIASLVICGLGAIVAIGRRRWTMVLTLVGMTLVACASWRNMAVGTMIAVPVALGALCRVRVRGGVGLARSPAAHAPPAVVGAATICASVIACFVTGTLHRIDSRLPAPVPGRSAAHLPLGAVDWLAQNDVRGRVWAAPTCTSTIYGFAQPTHGLNLVTNTWAYPPEVMGAVLRAGGTWGPHDFEATARRFEIGVVVTPPGAFLRELAASGNWTPVHLEAGFVVLARAEHTDDELAAIDLGGDSTFGGRIDRRNADALADLGRIDDAITVLTERASGIDWRDPRTWALLADIHRRAVLAGQSPSHHARAARHALLHALELDDDPVLRANLQGIERLEAHALAGDGSS